MSRSSNIDHSNGPVRADAVAPPSLEDLDLEPGDDLPIIDSRAIAPRKRGFVQTDAERFFADGTTLDRVHQFAPRDRTHTLELHKRTKGGARLSILCGGRRVKLIDLYGDSLAELGAAISALAGANRHSRGAR